MANIIDSFRDKVGNLIYPKTLTKAVYEEGTNKRLDTTLEENKTDILSLETTVGDVAMTTSAQTVTGAINELDADIGNKTTLTTTDKTNLVNAINEHEAQIENLDNILAELTKEPIVATLNPVSGYAIPISRISKKNGWVECFFKLEKEDGSNFAAGQFNVTLTDIIPVGYRIGRWLEPVIHGAISSNTNSTITHAGNFIPSTGQLQINISTACKTLVLYFVYYVGGGTI